MRYIRFITAPLLLVLVGFSLSARAADSSDIGALLEEWKDAGRDRAVPIKIDYPRTIDKPMPVVILSHGLGGSREGLAYIGQYLAGHGYVAVHLQHPGSDEALWQGVAPADRLANMKKGITAEQFSARIKDVVFALDELAKRNADPAWPLHGKLDLSRIAMAGHSFGAITTQAMCGQTFAGGVSFYDPRIKVGVAFSPSPPAVGDPKVAFASIKIPMLYWTGTRDEVPAISKVKPIDRRIPFDMTNGSDAYLIIITNADHMVFNGRARAGATMPAEEADWLKVIEEGTAAFLDKYLKGDEDAGKYLDGGKFAKEAEKVGTFEVKKRARLE